jgi:hypothetical protein
VRVKVEPDDGVATVDLSPHERCHDNCAVFQYHQPAGDISGGFRLEQRLAVLSETDVDSVAAEARPADADMFDVSDQHTRGIAYEYVILKIDAGARRPGIPVIAQRRRHLRALRVLIETQWSFEPEL